jgi:hypothetical protein
MNLITYTPAEVLKWFDTESRRANAHARAQTQEIAKIATEDGLIPTIKQAAVAAISITKGAYGTVVQKQTGETKYDLYEQGLEFVDLTRRTKVDYKQIRQIVAKPGDRFQILYNGGSLSIKPPAHLVAGKLRVPVGWIRNGIEVPYLTLVEEISARSGVEIIAE